jgi:hypothetical protein
MPDPLAGLPQPREQMVIQDGHSWPQTIGLIGLFFSDDLRPGRKHSCETPGQPAHEPHKNLSD